MPNSNEWTVLLSVVGAGIAGLIPKAIDKFFGSAIAMRHKEAEAEASYRALVFDDAKGSRSDRAEFQKLLLLRIKDLEERNADLEGCLIRAGITLPSYRPLTTPVTPPSSQ